MGPAPTSWPPGRPLRLATRGSPLARLQCDLVASMLRELAVHVDVEIVVVSTRGDELAHLPLDQIGGQGAFVKEVQLAVLSRRADLAVHSAKDLPPVAPEGLVVAAVPKRADPRDVLIGRRLDDLGPGSTVATGSARRRAQLAHLHPDLEFVELRGNMARRLERAESGDVDVVVAAAAAMERLGWLARVAEVLPVEVMCPQVGQGSLAVECRDDDEVLLELLAGIDHAPSHATLLAERSLLAALGASCSAPVGGYARWLDDESLELDAVMASADGAKVVRAQRIGEDPASLGTDLARHLLDDLGGNALGGFDRPVAPVPGR